MSLIQAVCLRIHELREERGLTVNALAAVCGINQSTLFSLTSGRRITTSIATIQKICDGLGIEMDEFFRSELFVDVKHEYL